ncbi:hypothetical protein M514_25784 [Trichuris suis]|uniref:PDZ domain-containing protein n=1 Tax=Trichuris suis TaxID=68888 RepID=A0A085MXW8_9BILA|nr:hypothetical protein M514_25783 [Trichuris suis]KFD62065.1 hypothetical protein M514_25784 [Trichuris suis]
MKNALKGAGEVKPAEAGTVKNALKGASVESKEATRGDGGFFSVRSAARSVDTPGVRSPTLSSPARLSCRLPDCLVKTVEIVKNKPNLGGNFYSSIQIEPGKDGISGCTIKSMDTSGAIYADGRLHVGDLILRINNQDLRYALAAQAKAILRRSSLLKSIRVIMAFNEGQNLYKKRAKIH